MTYSKFTKASAKQKDPNVSQCKPAFGYYGAKQRISKSIIELLPPHNAWVEVFCGSAAITVAKKPVPIEVINDIDSNIVNLFEQLRKNKKRIVEAIELTPYSREELQNCKIAKSTDSNLEKARKFFILTMMTVNGTIGDTNCGFSFSNSYTRGGVEARVSRWNNVPVRILNVIERLKNVRIENLDARSILKQFSDRPASLLYLDPPYFVKRSHDYPNDNKDRVFHEEILDLCCTSKAMILVSNYDNKLYRKYLNRDTGWVRKVIKTTTRDTRSGNNFYRNEIIWMNKKLVNAKNTGKVPIRLSKMERKEHKINPPR